MENWVFSELYKRLLYGGYTLLAEQGRGEVDFVVEQAGKLMALEVKAADLETSPGSVGRRTNYRGLPAGEVVVLNLSLETHRPRTPQH